MFFLRDKRSAVLFFAKYPMICSAIIFFLLTFRFFKVYCTVIIRRTVKKDKTMRNLTTAFFLVFIFCAVSVFGFPKANRSFRDTLWEKRLKEWEKRQSAVPQRLPRATTFKPHKHSSSRSFRSSHRSFRSSHRVRHVRRGRTHVRRRSRR